MSADAVGIELMPEVVTDGKIVVPFTFDNKTDFFVFASIERLENQIMIVRAALDRAEHGNDPSSIRLKAELAELTDEWLRQDGRSTPRNDYGASGDPLKELLLARKRRENGADDFRSDKTKEPEPDSSTPGDSEPRKGLDDDLSKAAASVIVALKAGGDDATALRERFALAGQPIGDADASTATFCDQPVVPRELPTVAPKLWRDRPPGMKATEFVAEYYRPWIEDGVLTLLAIKECDPALYDAYRVRVHRKPEEAVALAEGKPKHFIADPQEAIDRVRRSSRESIARRRAARRDNLARSPD